MDHLLNGGVDILQGISSIMNPYKDMKKLKDVVKGKMSLWGGVNEAVTVQSGSEDEIRKEVEEAVNTLGSDGGFVICPVDNILLTTDEAWEKVMMFIKAWNEIKSLKLLI